MTSADDPLCGACLVRPPVFDSTFSPLLFKFPIDRLIHRFKFQRDLASGAVLGRLLARKLSLLEQSMPDLLLAVPMHRFRLLHRGFNQSFEIARQLGNLLDVPVAIHELQRLRHTPAQSGLDANCRRKNLKAGAAKKPNEVSSFIGGQGRFGVCLGIHEKPLGHRTGRPAYRFFHAAARLAYR